MKKTLLILFIVTLMLLSITYGETNYYFRVNTPSDLKVACFNENNSICPDTTTCQITILYSNQTSLVINESMTYNYNYFNYSLSQNQNSIMGEYYATVACQGTEDGYSLFKYKVTWNGIDDTPFDTTSGLSITIFVLLIAIAFLYFGASKGNLDFSSHDEKTSKLIANVILKRGAFVIGIYLMVLNTSIIASIAQSAGLRVTKELFFYLWLLGMIGYIAIIFLVLKALVDVLQLYDFRKKLKRTG